jgi:protein-S-isoprenylcysteine O-methyltransferase Ste14
VSAVADSLKGLLLWFDLVACLVCFGLAIWFGPRTGFWYAGLGLGAVCLPLWVLARIQLGSSFTVRPEARRLVMHGLYARLRHPIYLFGSGAYFGAFLALQIWPILAAWMALLPLEFVRARRENRVLAERFGEEYERYRRGTWF